MNVMSLHRATHRSLLQHRRLRVPPKTLSQSLKNFYNRAFLKPQEVPMIGERIRMARLAAGLTLMAMGERLGLSHTAIQKFEKGVLTPSSDQILRLAQACQVRSEFFFRTQQLTLTLLPPKGPQALGRAGMETLRRQVIAALEPRIELRQAFPVSPVPHFVAPARWPRQVTSMAEIEDLADALRAAWQMGQQAIAHVTRTLEMHGMLVVMLAPYPPDLGGLLGTVQTPDGPQAPVMVIAEQMPFEQQRLAMAQLLGQCLLTDRLAKGMRMDKACALFAGAWLAPAAAVREALGTTRAVLAWHELQILQAAFGLPLPSLLERVHQCGVISSSHHQAMQRQLRARGHRHLAPESGMPPERPTLHAQLVHRALAEKRVSLAKAAEWLGQPMMQLQRERLLASAHGPHDQ